MTDTDRHHDGRAPRSIVVTHHRSAIHGWIFECSDVPSINGGGGTYEESVEASMHSARRYLQIRTGGAVDLDDVRRVLEHRAGR